MADVITRLRVESSEYDSKIKRASQGLIQMEQACRKVGGTLAILEKDELEFVKGLGKMETVSKDARGQLNELTKAFTDLSLQYKRLTDEEKQGDFGKALASSLGELKTRIQDTKKDLADIGQELSGSKFGQFGGIIDGIGHKMGVSANLTELLTSKTALMTAGIGAAVAAIYKGTEAWTKYNAVLSKQDQQTQVITGLKGSEADRMTDVMRALSDTYKVDFRQAVEAANTLMSQFGVSGSEAIQLIRDGMQGMIQGDGPKLLSMIQQYAPSFRDAGISASQLVAIIHNSEGGIFTDQNMNAIVMGIKNIRLMTKQTSDALAQLGIDGNQMSQQLSNGSLTVFDALKQVASELKNVDSNSKTAGEVMQTVFGRQGAMAGTNLAKAIETLNTNLKETKKQTGELGDAFAELQTANEKLNTAIRDAFSYDGWEQMANGIKATLISTLADVIEKLGKIRDFVAPGGITTRRVQNRRVEGEVKDVQSATQGEGDSAKIKQQQILDKYDREIERKQAELERAKKNVESAQKATIPNQASIRTAKNIQENIESEIQSLRKMKEEFRQESNKVITPPSPVTTEPEKPTPDPNKPGSIVKTTAVTAKELTAKELNPMQQAQKEISALTEEALTADEGRLEVIKKEIAALQEQVNVYKSIQDFVQGKEPNWNIQVGDRKAFETEQRKRFGENTVTPSRLQVMEASVMKEIRVEDAKVDTETLHTLLKDALQNSIDTTSLDLAPIAEQIGEGINVPDEKWQEILDKYNELRAQIGEEPIQIDFNTGNKSKNSGDKSKNSENVTGISIMNKMSGGISSIAGGIEQLGIKLPEGLNAVLSGIQGIASILSGISAIVSAIEVMTTVSSSLPFFARGGIVHAAGGLLVPGHDYSDSTPVMVSSGELILNKAQQNTIASLLQESNAASVSSTPYVSGEQIYLGLTNYLIRSGRGELLTARG